MAGAGDCGRLRHRLAASHAYRRPARRVREKIEVKRIIAILAEDALAAIAPLVHMMRNAGKHDAGKPGHAIDWRSSRANSTGQAGVVAGSDQSRG